MLNIHLCNISQRELLTQFHGGVLFNPNVDHLVRLQTDRELYDAYQQADYIICDSRILFFFSKLLKNPVPETISGSTFFREYCNFHRNDENVKVFILGGKEGVAERAKERINAALDSHIIVEAHAPSFHIDDEESRQIAERINRSGANVVMVALGVPKQEIWIAKYRHLMPQVTTWMALGATVDFEAGTLKRAPEIWRVLGMEWLFRFLQEPRRLFRRYFIDDMKFFWYFGKQLLGIYKNPFE